MFLWVISMMQKAKSNSHPIETSQSSNGKNKQDFLSQVSICSALSGGAAVYFVGGFKTESDKPLPKNV